MALTQSSLKGKLETEISAVINITDAAQLALVCGAIAAAVVDEFTSNAEVKSSGVTLSHAPGAAATITDLAGVIE